MCVTSDVCQSWCAMSTYKHNLCVYVCDSSFLTVSAICWCWVSGHLTLLVKKNKSTYLKEKKEFMITTRTLKQEFSIVKKVDKWSIVRQDSENEMKRIAMRSVGDVRHIQLLLVELGYYITDIIIKLYNYHRNLLCRIYDSCNTILYMCLS